MHKEGRRVLEEKPTSVNLSTQSEEESSGGSGLPVVGGVGLRHCDAHSRDSLTSSLTGHISILQYILQRKSETGKRRRREVRRNRGEGEKGKCKSPGRREAGEAASEKVNQGDGGVCVCLCGRESYAKEKC